MHQRLATWVAALALGVAVTPMSAAAQAPVAQQRAQRYRATTPVVKDQATGRRRMPTEQEVRDMVATLSSLTARPEVATEVATASGAVSADVSSGFGGVMLARAAEDGTFETLCVFTFEEGAAFLGLVPDVQ
jgi:hypothetical protein